MSKTSVLTWCIPTYAIMQVFGHLVMEVAREKCKKNALFAQICVLSDSNKRLQAWSLLIFWVRINIFLKNYITSEGAVSHNVLYYQQLSILLVNNCFFASRDSGGPWWGYHQVVWSQPIVHFWDTGGQQIHSPFSAALSVSAHAQYCARRYEHAQYCEKGPFKSLPFDFIQCWPWSRDHYFQEVPVFLHGLGTSQIQ